MGRTKDFQIDENDYLQLSNQVKSKLIKKKKMANLFEISAEMQSITEQLIDNGGELTPELEEALKITKPQLEQKAVAYSVVIRSMKYENETIDAEIERLKKFKKTKSNSIERLENALKNAMIICDVDKIETATSKIGFRKSQTLEIINADNVPTEYKTIEVKETTKIDKMQIKKDIKAGVEVAGVELINNKNLQIK